MVKTREDRFSKELTGGDENGSVHERKVVIVIDWSCCFECLCQRSYVEIHVSRDFWHIYNTKQESVTIPYR